jgi:NAD(P)-dependent dehydrogenase (short-subunit alcohol dehydrogenase family)
MAEKMDESGAGWLGLSGRVCAVTGAGGGIGAEIAGQLVRAGARVALLDRNAETLQSVAQGLGQATNGQDDQVMQFACDVTRADSIQSAAQQIHAAWGPVTLLVNNAGALYADALMDIALDKWNQLLAVNLSGYLLCAQVFGRQMIAAGGGAMVHVASIAGSVPQPYSGAYSVSKAGVMMLSRLLAVELGEHGVRSNVVSPAMICTPMSEGIYADPQVRRRREEIVPAGRIGTPEDIAAAVLFLASERAGYLSGQELLVDGGLTQAWLAMIPRPGFEKQAEKQVEKQAAAASPH